MASSDRVFVPSSSVLFQGTRVHKLFTSCTTRDESIPETYSTCTTIIESTNHAILHSIKTHGNIACSSVVPCSHVFSRHTNAHHAHDPNYTPLLISAPGFLSPNAKPVTFACCGIPIYCHPNNPRPTFRVNCHTPQPVQPAQNVRQHSRCANQATSVGHKMR